MVRNFYNILMNPICQIRLSATAFGNRRECIHATAKWKYSTESEPNDLQFAGIRLFYLDAEMSVTSISIQEEHTMQLDPNNLLDELEEHMMKTEDSLRSSFNAIRTGKASPALVEGLMVEYYGTQTRLRDIAGITAPEPRLLVIQPWDSTAVHAIEKAILASNIGITPMSDGRTLKLPIPELSQDRRTALTKQAKAETEEGKVALRNIRREGNEVAKKAQKDGVFTEDELKKLLDDIQKLTDRYIATLDRELAAKEKELMTV